VITERYIRAQPEVGFPSIGLGAESRRFRGWSWVVLLWIGTMWYSRWTKMSATRAVGGQDDIAVVWMLVECLAGLRGGEVCGGSKGVRWAVESKSVVRSDRELEYAAMTKTPNLSLNLAADS
jgi:hypothetical protein